MSAAATEIVTPVSKLIGLGLVAAVGVQTMALYAGLAEATRLPWILAAPVALALGTAVLLLWPLIATLLGFASAILVWHWPWPPRSGAVRAVGRDEFHRRWPSWHRLAASGVQRTAKIAGLSPS